MSAKLLSYQEACAALKEDPKEFLITGGAGFIGSHICDKLLSLGQRVRILDNFSTGSVENIDYLRQKATEYQANLLFIEGDIRDRNECAKAVLGVDYVSHQAALGSIPRSIAEPEVTHDVNVTGFINMLNAAKDASVKAFVYASSSSVYGDHPVLPKVEAEVGNILSPYAATKKMNEIYADVFFRSYAFAATGLRYFNIFGPRQSPDGPYAAVIPRWLEDLKNGSCCQIFGDGETSRDFCFVDNAVQANILALVNQQPASLALNIAVGEQTSLTTLAEVLAQSMSKELSISCPAPVYKEFRDGDIKHSLANIDLARRSISYKPSVAVEEGLAITVSSFIG